MTLVRVCLWGFMTLMVRVRVKKRDELLLKYYIDIENIHKYLYSFQNIKSEIFGTMTMKQINSCNENEIKIVSYFNFNSSEFGGKIGHTLKVLYENQIDYRKCIHFNPSTRTSIP